MDHELNFLRRESHRKKVGIGSWKALFEIQKVDFLGLDNLWLWDQAREYLKALKKGDPWIMCWFRWPFVLVLWSSRCCQWKSFCSNQVLIHKERAREREKFKSISPCTAMHKHFLSSLRFSPLLNFEIIPYVRLFFYPHGEPVTIVPKKTHSSFRSAIYTRSFARMENQ